MSFNANTQIIVNDDGQIVPGQFSTRANLPTGAAGYLAYVTDQKEFVVNTGQVSHPSTTNIPPSPTTTTNSPDNGVTWYKFLMKPNDYKNEVILEQGTIGGGYSSSSTSGFNAIDRFQFNNDVTNRLLATLPWLSFYSASHSTYLYAYYHQGASGSVGTSKMDWSTLTMSSITSRPGNAGNYNVGAQPGPKLQNTFGVIQQTATGYVLTFATDSWTAGYNPPVSASTYNWFTFSESSGYQNHPGYSYTYKLNWSNASWSAAAGNPPNSSGTWAKALPTKWNKFYSGGSANNIDRYNTPSDTWTGNVNYNINGAFQETEGVMAQDWGYWFGYYGGYSTTGTKMFYPTDTSTYTRSMSYGHSSGHQNWGPLP